MLLDNNVVICAFESLKQSRLKRFNGWHTNDFIIDSVIMSLVRIIMNLLYSVIFGPKISVDSLSFLSLHFSAYSIFSVPFEKLGPEINISDRKKPDRPLPYISITFCWALLTLFSYFSENSCLF